MSNRENAETLTLHAGYRREPATHAVAVPRDLATSFRFDDILADLAQALERT